MKKLMLAITVFGLLVNGAIARPDLTDMVSKNMKSIGGSGSLYWFVPYNGNRYDVTSFNTGINFSYETFFKNKWSFEINPSFNFTNIYDSDSYLWLNTAAEFNYYFNDHDLLPYINWGLVLGFNQFGNSNDFLMQPSLRVGLIKEIKDQLYFDFAIQVPTFVGFSANKDETRFGLVGITFPIYFGIRYYYM